MRMNISVPDELREKMKPFDDATNWSNVAVQAFQKKVDLCARLAAIDDVVKRRLIATDAEDDDDVQAMGQCAGEAWAKEAARMIQLRRLAAFEASEDGPEFGDPDVIASAIHGLPVTWAGVPGLPPLPDGVAIESGWCEGFVNGALGVYHAVKG